MRRSPTPDLEALVSAQLERDQRIEPFMRERKCTRMRVSPHAFLRGTAALFYDLVRERGRVATFPSAKGGLCGDLHLETFGVFRTNRPKKDRSHLVFAVNNFDDATEGPFVLDLLRLLTSLLLAVRAPLPDGEARLSLAKVCSNAYARAIVRGGGSAKRTPKGHLEISQSKKSLPAKLRTVLFLVDPA